jgi:SAM-dependent methyltransferase
MEFTGERLVPGKVEPDLYNEHLSRYLLARRLASGRKVLDLGCGSGYGAQLLAETAACVVGLDLSWEAVDYARKQFAAPNLQFLVSDAASVAIASASFDAIICFEVIEHLVEQQALLEEASRLLNRQGILIISTPNRIFYTEERRSVNPFHTREFDCREFHRFLSASFNHVEVLYQNHIPSLLVGRENLPLQVVADMQWDMESMEQTSNFFLAICAQRREALPPLESLVFLPSSGNLLREKEQRISSLEAKLTKLDAKILQLQKEYDRQTEWCLNLDETLKQRDSRILQLQKDYDGLQREFDERSAWALRLAEETSEKDERILKLQGDFDERTAYALRLEAQLERVRQSRLYKMAKVVGLAPKV